MAMKLLLHKPKAQIKLVTESYIQASSHETETWFSWLLSYIGNWVGCCILLAMLSTCGQAGGCLLTCRPWSTRDSYGSTSPRLVARRNGFKAAVRKRLHWARQSPSRNHPRINSEGSMIHILLLNKNQQCWWWSRDETMSFPLHKQGSQAHFGESLLKKPSPRPLTSWLNGQVHFRLILLVLQSLSSPKQHKPSRSAPHGTPTGQGELLRPQ